MRGQYKCTWSHPQFHSLKINNNDKFENYCIKINLRRYLKSKNLDLYELKISLFGNSDLEEFLLFVSNLNITIEASVTITPGENIKYLCKLICGEALLQFDTLYYEVGSNTPENLTSIILVLGM